MARRRIGNGSAEMSSDVVEERVPKTPYEDATEERSDDREWLERRFTAIEQRLDRAERQAPRRRRGMHALTAFITLLVVLALLVAAGAAGTWYVMQADERAVPRVTGLQLEQAVSRLQDEGFKADISSRPDARPAGVVLRQSPIAGAKRDDGSTVAIVASTGPAA